MADKSKLDELDLKLLRLIQEKASLSYRELSKLAGTSAPTTWRKLKRFKEIGIIDQELYVLNPENLREVLGSSLSIVMSIELKRLADSEYEQFEEQLIRNPSVQQMYKLKSGYEYFLILHVLSAESLNELIKKDLGLNSNVQQIKFDSCIKRLKFGSYINLPLAQE